VEIGPDEKGKGLGCFHRHPRVPEGEADPDAQKPQGRSDHGGPEAPLPGGGVGGCGVDSLDVDLAAQDAAEERCEGAEVLCNAPGEYVEEGVGGKGPDEHRRGMTCEERCPDAEDHDPVEKDDLHLPQPAEALDPSPVGKGQDEHRHENGGYPGGEGKDGAQKRRSRKELGNEGDERSQGGGHGGKDRRSLPEMAAEELGKGDKLRRSQGLDEPQSHYEAADAAPQGEPPGGQAVMVRHLYRPDGGRASDKAAEDDARNASGGRFSAGYGIL